MYLVENHFFTLIQVASQIMCPILLLGFVRLANGPRRLHGVAFIRSAEIDNEAWHINENTAMLSSSKGPWNRQVPVSTCAELPLSSESFNFLGEVQTVEATFSTLWQFRGCSRLLFVDQNLNQLLHVATSFGLHIGP